MANPTPAYFGLTGDHAIDAITHGYYWRLDATRTIDWALASGWTYWANPPAMAQALGTMFSWISYYANVRFNYVGSYASPTAAYAAGSEITISNAANGSVLTPQGVLGYGLFAFPDSAARYYVGEAGDVFINASANLPSYAPGSEGWFLFLHEIGHTLGLKHPHDDGGTGRPTFNQLGIGSVNKDWFSIMSYNDDYAWNQFSWDPVSPMILDVLALQYLYGKNMATNAGDSTLQLSRTNYYTTYWDAWGQDTVSAESSNEGWSIHLPDTRLSNLVDTRSGYAMPLRDVGSSSLTTLFWLAGDLENATGSSSADWLYGTSASNALNGGGGDDYLYGGGGSDVLTGGTGTDTAGYAGALREYAVRKSGSSIQVQHKPGTDGTDLLFSIERLQFSDATLDLTARAKAAAVPAATLQTLVELYVAFFNRVPDAEGITFWVDRSAAGTSLASIANSFYTAALQYPQLTGYSSNMTNAAFVDKVYRNVLGRNGADADGLAYWTGALASGRETRGSLVKTILDSAHTFKGNAQFGYVANLLDNKYAVGKYLSIDLGLGYTDAQTAISKGMAVAAAVTPTDTQAAIALVGISSADFALA
jgi:serralysin